MELKPGMFTQSVIKYHEKRESQRKNGAVDRSLAAVMFALTVGIDLITFPFTYAGSIIDGLISQSSKKNTPTSIRI
jgi:hypothetical protein